MKRQGDLLFVTGEVPGDANSVEDGVIFRGTSTGNAHRFVGDGVVRKMGEDLFVEVGPGGGEIVHEEHGTIRLESGGWQVRRQREYEPGGWRTVSD